MNAHAFLRWMKGSPLAAHESAAVLVQLAIDGVFYFINATCILIYFIFSTLFWNLSQAKDLFAHMNATEKEIVFI